MGYDYFDYDGYDENDEYNEEGDNEEEYGSNEFREKEIAKYKNIIADFINNYRHNPINVSTFHLLKDVYKKLEGLAFEEPYLRKVFYEDIVNGIENLAYKKKFLTEVFLYQFKDLNIEKNSTEILKKLYEYDTHDLAKLFYQNDHYSFIMRYILDVVDSAEKKANISNTSSYSSNQTSKSNLDDDYGYDYSDTLYWEAVHDGEINPDDDSDNRSASDHDIGDGYDSDNSYDKVDNRDYTDLERISPKLGEYFKLLEKATPYSLPINEIENFLEKFKEYDYLAESILSDIKVKDHIHRIYSKLDLLGREEGLKVQISQSFDKTIKFNRKNGEDFLKVTLFKPINKADSSFANSFSLFVDEIKKNVTTRDLNFVITILQAIGYDIDDRYINFINDVIKKDDFNEHVMSIGSGHGLKVICHWNELRHDIW